jgi:hypothetical protein
MFSRRQQSLLLQLAILLFTNVVSARPAISIKPAPSSNRDNHKKHNRVVAVVCGTIGGLIVICVVLYAIFCFCKSYYKTKIMHPVVQRSRTMSFAATGPTPQRSRTMSLFRRASMAMPAQTPAEAAHQPFLSDMSSPVPLVREEDGPPAYELAARSPLTPLSPAFTPGLERGQVGNSH